MFFLPFTDWFAGELVDFQSSNDPLAIVGVNGRCHARIDFRQAPVQECQSILTEFTRQVLPNGWIFPRPDEKTLSQRLQVKPCAAANHRLSRSLMNLFDARPCRAAKQRSVKFFIGVDDIDQMVRYASSVRHRRLSGADIHVAINLLGIGIDYFTVQFSRKRSEEHTSELQSLRHLVCRLLLGKK